MKVAVAGLGWWGKQIIRCLGKSAKFQVLYGVDPKPPTDIGDFATEFRIKIASDLETVLDDRTVDGVVLATPHSLHEQQILAVVAADKNVFCEKPLTLTAAGAGRVISACDKAGKILGVGHERRWEPAFEELARLIKAGALGKLLYMDANVSHNLLGRLEASNWRRDPAQAPAGLMTGVGVHLTDLFISFVGPASEVRAQTAQMAFQPPADDFVTASIRFKSGVRATITLLSATPFYGRFSVYGDAGWVEVVSAANVDQGKPTTLTHSDDAGRRTVTYQAIDAVILNFEAWADAVEKRTSYRFSSEQLLENIRLFEAIVESSQNGGAIRQL